MAHALEYALVSLGLILLSALPAHGLTLTGVDMVSTSKTLSIQHTKAGVANISADGKRVLADNLEVKIRLQNGEMATAGAARGEIVIAGADGAKPQPLGDWKSVSEYNRRFDTMAGTGDILLENPGLAPIAEMGDSGVLNSTRLIWSEAEKKYILPANFTQTAVAPSGMSLRIEGNGAVINQDFSESHYFGNENGTTITIERPLEKEKK